MRVASPEASRAELTDFRPHLLIHNDNDGLDPEDLASVLCRVVVLYTDGMDAHISVDDTVSDESDISTKDLLRTVDAAIALADREAD